MEHTNPSKPLVARASLLLATVLTATSYGCATEPATTSDEFEQLTVVTYPGYWEGSPAGSSCNVADYPETRSLDRASRELTWDICSRPPGGTLDEPVSGGRVLTDTEFDSVVEALDDVVPSDRTGCGADAQVITLDVRTEEGTTLYADDFYAGCPWEVHRGRTFAKGLGQLANTLSELGSQ